MTFLQQLIADAQPKAETLAKAAKNITLNAYNSKPVQITRGLTYKGTVNVTAGVMAAGLVVKPITDTVKEAGNAVWSAIERLADQPTVAEQK